MNDTPSPHDRDELRAKIYDSYVSSGAVGRPRSLDDLAPRMPYLRRLVRRHFPADPQSPILDLGCGSGALLHAAAEAGYRNLIGVDVSAEQVAVAHELGIPQVREGDLFGFLAGQCDGTFAVVITFDVIEHLSKPEILRIAAEIGRVLGPGGRWIIHVPNGESPFVGRIRYGDLTHEVAFTRWSLSALLHACKFSDVRCYEDAPVPHGLASAMRFVLWKLLRQFLRLYIVVETGESGAGSIFSQNLLAVAIRGPEATVAEQAATIG